MKIFSFLFIICLFQLTCQSPTISTNESPSFVSPSIPVGDKMAGLSFVAPPNPFDGDPMKPIVALGANWIAAIPYAFTLLGEPSVHFNSDRQWWGERPEGTIETIRIAQAAGIKVMLKPQVYIPGSWPGGLDFKTDREWEQWESDYEKYIMTFVAIADSMDVGLFCIGTEFKFSETKRVQFWRKLIKKIRAEYKGKLVYASNWDSYEDVPFWDALDYIGIDAYFPLIDKKEPSVAEIKKAWEKYLRPIRKLHKKTNRPVLFTEYGYLSVDGCTYNTWELEKDRQKYSVNEQAQANALQALHEVFWPEPYYHGGFLWKWFPDVDRHSKRRKHGYTPQGKKGEEFLQAWYRGDGNGN